MSVDLVTNHDIVCDRGDSLTIRLGPVTTEDENGVRQPVDLTVGGTKMWLTVKKSVDDDDAAAVVQLTHLAGITLNSPVVAAKNFATALIPEATFADPAVAAFAERTVLVWDAVFEVGTRHERIARGKIIVVPSVTRAT